MPTDLDGEFKLKGEFLAAESDRSIILERSEKYAGWTLPYIFPDDPLTSQEELQNDFQSVGAQAVTNLSNKILMALFQPARPFYRMQLTKEQRISVSESTGLSDAQIDAGLAKAERDGMRELDKLNARVAMNDMVQQLIITGNSLLHMPQSDEETMQVYSIRDYTIKRDLRGTPVKIILRETKSIDGLSDNLRAMAEAEGYGEKDDVSLYTGIVRVGDRYKVWQELEDVCYCHKRVGLYNKDSLPWIPLTWNLARGKDYGTGLVESYAGDFHTLSTLAEAILDFTTVATDVKNLVNPTGMTDVREITQAPSGAYVHGREEDIVTYSADITDASNFLTNQFEVVSRRIGAAFLLNTAVTRDAERVTAEEIRMQAHELESSLGGVYSRLATELQLPLAKRIMKRIDKQFKSVEPIIVTGFESLSRNSELGNLRAFVQDLVGLAEVPDEVKLRLKFGDVIALLGAGHGVDYKSFLKDESQVERDKKAAIAAQAQAAGAEAGAVTAAQGQGQ
jgi:hypothetical protein